MAIAIAIGITIALAIAIAIDSRSHENLSIQNKIPNNKNTPQRKKRRQKIYSLIESKSK